MNIIDFLRVCNLIVIVFNLKGRFMTGFVAYWPFNNFPNDPSFTLVFWVSSYKISQMFSVYDFQLTMTHSCTILPSTHTFSAIQIQCWTLIVFFFFKNTLLAFTILIYFCFKLLSQSFSKNDIWWRFKPQGKLMWLYYIKYYKKFKL